MNVLYIVGAVLAVVVIAVLSVLVLTQDKSGPGKATTASSTKVVAFKADLSSFTTSGTGFRQSGGKWVTQSYYSADFGGLKPGVGLVLDLGQAQKVTKVEFTAGDGPLTVELRAADNNATSLDGWKVVGASNVGASGDTVLKTAGTKHRYWLIWVTRLGSGNKAELSNIKVSGTK